MAEPVAMTAQQLKERLGADLLVSIPGWGEWRCRRPDVQCLVFAELLPLPLLRSALREAFTYDDQGQRVSEELTIAEIMASGKSKATAEYIDRFLVLAAVSPRIVATRAEVDRDSVCVDDLTLPIKLALYAATKPQEVAAADGTFSAHADGPAPPTDGASVRDTPERPAVDLKSR